MQNMTIWPWTIHRPTDSSRQNPTVEPPCATVFCCTQRNGNGWMGWHGSDVEIKRRAEAKGVQQAATDGRLYQFVKNPLEFCTSIESLCMNWDWKLRMNEDELIDDFFIFSGCQFHYLESRFLTFGVLNTYRYQIQGVFFLKKLWPKGRYQAHLLELDPRISPCLPGDLFNIGPLHFPVTSLYIHPVKSRKHEADSWRWRYLVSRSGVVGCLGRQLWRFWRVPERVFVTCRKR